MNLTVTPIYQCGNKVQTIGGEILGIVTGLVFTPNEIWYRVGWVKDQTMASADFLACELEPQDGGGLGFKVSK
jgi:hypothetical protein